MRRITAVVAGILAVAGLVLAAGPADAAATKHPKHRRMHLTCAEASGSITCTWNAADGATSYTVVERYRQRRHHTTEKKTVTATTFTTSATNPGQYQFVVQAVGSDGKAVARSNRAHVHVKKAA
jgi:hypothetical protein